MHLFGTRDVPRLTVSLRGMPIANYVITGQRTRIGRSAENDVVLNDPQISSAHAVLIQHGSKFIVEDLGSTNGTFLAGQRIASAELHDGAALRIGEYALTLVADPVAMAYEPTMLIRSIRTRARLLWIDGPRQGELMELKKVVETFGTPRVCMVTCIRRANEFAILFTEGQFVPKLNGEALTARPVRLNPGDVLELDTGRLQFIVLDA
jgi:hypothetical protein